MQHCVVFFMFLLQGKYLEAVTLYDRSVQIYVLHYGHSHPKVQETMDNRELASQKVVSLSL